MQVDHDRSGGQGGEIAGLRQTIRSVVEARLVLDEGSGSGSGSDIALAMAETTVRLLAVALDSAPAIVFAAAAADAHEASAPLAALSQLCATLTATANANANANSNLNVRESNYVPSTPAIPFDTWIRIKLTAILLVENYATLHDQTIHTLRFYLELYNDLHPYHLQTLLIDFIRLASDLGSYVSNKTAAPFTVCLLASQKDEFTGKCDADALSFRFSSFQQCIPALANLLKLFRLLDDSNPAQIIDFLPLLMETSLQALCSIQVKPHPSFLLECLDSWRKYLHILDSLPPAYLIAPLLHTSIQYLIISLNERKESSKSSSHSAELYLAIDIKMARLLEVVISCSDVHFEAKDRCETGDEFEMALSGCGVEQLVSSDLLSYTQTVELKVFIFNLFHRVLQISVVQGPNLVQQLLDHVDSPVLYESATKCLYAMLAQTRAVNQAFQTDAANSLKRSRTTESDDSISKRIRVNSAGNNIPVFQSVSMFSTNVDLLAKIALDMLGLCFKDEEKDLNLIHKMNVICRSLLVPQSRFFSEFIDSVMQSFTEVCAKFCKNIISGLGAKSPPNESVTYEYELRLIGSVSRAMSIHDPKWAQEGTLLLHLTLISFSPWIHDLLSLSSSLNAVEAAAHKEVLSLCGTIDNTMAGFDVSQGAESNIACFSCSEDARLEAIQTLASIHSGIDHRRFQHCRTVVLWMELNNDTRKQMNIWEAIGPIMSTLNESCWIWISERLVFDANSSPQRLLAGALNLGRVACSLSGTLSPTGSSVPTCKVCDEVSLHVPTTKPLSECSLSLRPWTKFEFLLKSSASTNECRTNFISSMRRILSHIKSEELFLETSPFLVLAIGGLTSSTRNIRLGTSLFIPHLFPYSACSDFISIEHKVLESNKLQFFTSIKQLLETSDVDVLESCIICIGNLGRNCCEKLLLPVLYCLIDQLSDKNILLKSIAFEQIKYIAKFRNKAPYDLILPYLPEISVYLMDRLKISGLFKDFSKVLGLNPKAFIERTISHTLPHLIIHQQTDLIQELANVLNMKIGVLCVNQMSHILKAIFMLNQDTYNPITYVRKIAQLEIEDISMKGLILSCALELVTNLVMELGDSHEGVQKKAKNALLTMNASLLDDNAGAKKKAAVNGDAALSEFLLNHFLGILSFVNQSLTDQTGRVSVGEKVKIVNGLVELMKLVGNRITSLIPQIMTTLQTALAIDSIRNVALNGWEVFVGILGPRQIGPILNQVVGILMKGWSGCSELESVHIIKIIEAILVRHSEVLKVYFNDLCEFPRQKEFNVINAVVDPHRKNEVLDKMKRLLKAVSHDNSVVVESALFELKLLLRKEQAYLLTEILSESGNDVIGEAVSVLLETLKKYNGTRVDLQLACCESLGVLGAPDPARLHVTINSSMDISLESFEAKDTTDVFVCKFIEKQLAPAFRSATNPQSQAHLAFAIQELLQFCGFTVEFQNLGSRSDAALPTGSSARMVTMWQNFPRAVLDVIRPLLSTKYSIEAKSVRQLASPIYQHTSGFKDWLQFWVVDLMNKATGKYANRIFSVCTKVVESENIGIGLYLLPRLVLNVLTGGSTTHGKELLAEFTAVLNDVVGPTGGDNMEKQQLSSQTIFQLIDHLTVWIRSRRRDIGKSRAQQRKSTGKHVLDDEEDRDAVRQRVASFLAGIPTVLMAEASYRCKSYARALLHYEQHVRSERKIKSEAEMQPAYGFLQTIYSHLEEPDGIDGISTLFLNPTLEQQILEHESAGRWTSAQTCYEICLQNNPDELKLHTGLINCLKNLGHLSTMLTHISGIASIHPSWSAHLNSYSIEGAWRLGSWDVLDHVLTKPHLPSFETDVGKILSLAKQLRYQDFKSTLRKTREMLIAPLAAASMESYSRAYDCVVKLNMLHETEAACQHLWSEEQLESNGPNEIVLADTIMKSLDARLKITMPSLKVREPILNLRRILISDLGAANSQASAKLECGRIWLQTAKALRAAGHYQPAYSAIVHATELQTPNALLQKAKWLTETSQPHKAILELRTLIDRHYSNSGSPIQDSMKLLKAKTLLMYARRMDETNTGTSEVMFNAVTVADPKWEKGFFYLGRYHNKLLDREPTNQAKANTASQSKSSIIQPLEKINQDVNGIFRVCRNYLLALQYGTRYIYQTLPRLLTLWMGLGDLLVKKPDQELGKKHFERITKELRKLIEEMPAYIFLPAVPQLISRILHSNKSVLQMLELILATVLASYPQQTLWSLLGVRKSKYKNRSDRCESILTKVQADPVFRQANLNKSNNFIKEGVSLCEELLNLCNYPINSKETILTMNRDFPILKRMSNLNMILPIQKTLTVTLPSDGSVSKSNHLPFPFDAPTIKEFHNEIEVMNSLQKPRKITILGSNGRDYIFLLKPKDDLRKDARLMEFNGLINKLLKKDPEARRRNLRVRTYAVVPLNEECGIIEWVDNTCGFRNIVAKSYKAKGVHVAPQEIKELLERRPGGTDSATIFTQQVLPRFAPVFHEWFLETFPEPTKWFASRLSYSGTVAVMSMVGYVVGLGDRHGENILFDELSGDCVHVDLNCLFEKGTTFEKPERVPFRLTHNMVDAFGVTGTEGVFRKACETSLHVLRANRESLLAVLETFIHDPLCEWNKQRASTGVQRLGGAAAKELQREAENEEAVKHLTKIETKLKGIPKQGLVPLSIEGQVQELIAEATSPQNLSVMYIGWAPFL